MLERLKARLAPATDRVWSTLVVFLPDPRLLPAVVALVLYPFVSHVSALLAALAALVLVLIGGWISKRMLLKRWGEALTAALFLVVFVVVWLVLSAGFEDAWVEIGTFSGLAFRFALFGLLVAGVVLGLRIALMPTHSKLGVIVSGGGLGLIVGVCMFVGLLPGWTLVDDLGGRLLGLDGGLGLAVDLALCAVLGGLVFWATVRVNRASIVTHINRHWLPAAAGVALVLPALFLAAAVVDSARVGPGRDPPQYARGILPTVAPGTLAPGELAKRYRPVFLIDVNERWPIESVDAYLRDATVSRAGRPVLTGPRPQELPRSCADPAREQAKPERICFAMTAGCPDVKDTCDHGRDRPWTQADVPAGTVYARVVQAGKEGAPEVFGGTIPYSGLRTVIQYWIFYRDDLWRASTAVGRVEQYHEADWEYVMVGLGADKPMFVAYSAHCGGEITPWEQVRTSGAGDTVRPVVWVARGSHANYPGPDPRAPDFTSCPRAKRSVKFLFTQLAFAANVREVLPDALVHQDPAVVPVDAHYPAFSVPARWATQDATKIEGRSLPPRRAPRTEPAGPETPTCKGDWRDPLAILACSPYWEGEKGTCDGDVSDRYKRLESQRTAPGGAAVCL